MTSKANGKTRMKVGSFTRSDARRGTAAARAAAREAAARAARPGGPGPAGGMLKAGVNLWALPGRLTWEEALAEASRAGFDGVEPNLEKDGWITPSMSARELRGRAEVARQAGLEIISVATGLLWETSLTAPDADERRAARGIVEKQMRAALALGADTVLVVPGAVDVFFMPQRPRVRYDHAMARLIESLEELVPLAEKEGVNLALETVWNRFLLSPLEFNLLLDRFDSKRLAVYVDVGNLLLLGYPQDWIDILGPRIARVHVKGYRRSGGAGTDAGFCGILQGDIDWPEVVAALGRSGYRGYLTAEMFRPTRMPPHLFLGELANQVRWITSLSGGGQ